MEAVNYVLRLFEGDINPGDLTGIKICFQATNEKDKENYKLDISVSNAKDILDHSLGLYKIWQGTPCIHRKNCYRQK